MSEGQTIKEPNLYPDQELDRLRDEEGLNLDAGQGRIREITRQSYQKPTPQSH